MYRYAQILYETAHWIFETIETLDELYLRFPSDLQFVDITQLPQVEEGWQYQNGAFLPPPEPSLEEQLAVIRQQRDFLLAASDKYMLPDYPLTGAKRAAWQDYRQALRDFPDTCTLEALVWPLSPGAIE